MMVFRFLPRVLVVVVLGMLAIGCCSEENPVCGCEKEEVVLQFVGSPGAEPGSLPFSDAVRVGNLLFLSGQVGRTPGTREIVPGGIQAETTQVLENIKDVLERNGSSLDQVVKSTVFLTDITEWPAMNEVYRTYFPTNPPARSALAASGLALEARVEIECIAVVGILPPQEAYGVTSD